MCFPCSALYRCFAQSHAPSSSHCLACRTCASRVASVEWESQLRAHIVMKYPPHYQVCTNEVLRDEQYAGPSVFVTFCDEFLQVRLWDVGARACVQTSTDHTDQVRIGLALLRSVGHTPTD
jgi:hypothetical protein